MKTIEYLLKKDKLLLLNVEVYPKEIVCEVALLMSLYTPTVVVTAKDGRQFNIEMPEKYRGKFTVLVDDVTFDLVERSA